MALFNKFVCHKDWLKMVLFGYQNNFENKSFIMLNMSKLSKLNVECIPFISVNSNRIGTVPVTYGIVSAHKASTTWNYEIAQHGLQFVRNRLLTTSRSNNMFSNCISISYWNGELKCRTR